MFRTYLILLCFHGFAHSGNSLFLKIKTITKSCVIVGLIGKAHIRHKRFNPFADELPPGQDVGSALAQNSQPVVNPHSDFAKAISKFQANRRADSAIPAQDVAKVGNIGTSSSSGASVLGEEVWGQTENTQTGGDITKKGGFGTGSSKQTNVAGLPINEESKSSFGGINGPQGPFSGGFGLSETGGFDVIGSGYRNRSQWTAGWPDGFQSSKGKDITGLGNTWYQEDTDANWKPQGLATHDFGASDGTTAWRSGFKNGTTGQAGINGVDLKNGWSVPVLGQNIVQNSNDTKFDLAKMEYTGGNVGQYGPVKVVTDRKHFRSPWLGKLVQNAAWDGVYKNATDDKIGNPGGILPGGNNGMPNIPFFGRKKRSFRLIVK